jgi:hypothetical protein
MTGQRSSATTQEKRRELDLAMQQLANPNAPLANFIKFDTALGRDQNIDIKKDSSLQNSENMRLKGGVRLTQFHPEKKGQQMSSTYEESDEDEQSPSSPSGGP